MEDQTKLMELLNEFQEVIAQRNDASILHLMQVLAKYGRPFSCADVAQLYELGQPPVGLSLESAYKWYTRSAYEEEDKVGYFGLGRFYFDGRYVEKDITKATEFFKHAAALGSIEAHILAGFSYLRGRGEQRDLDQAERYLMPAAAEGYVAAYFLLSRLAKVRSRYWTATKFWFLFIIRAYKISRVNKSDPRLYSLHGIWQD